MNSVRTIKNLKTRNITVSFQERLQIKQLGPARPNLYIQNEHIVKEKCVIRRFNLSMYDSADAPATHFTVSLAY